MNLSPQQTAVINWVATGRGSAFVEAVAGAGKTSTLIEALAHTEGSVAFTAFNKKIAKEIELKIAERANPDHERYDPRYTGMNNRVRVGTFHSFGFSAWRKVHSRVKVDARAKSDELIAAVGAPEALETFVTKLVSLAKQRAIGLFGSVDDRSLWYDIVEHFDLAYEIEDDRLVEQGIERAIAGLRWSIDNASRLIDFDDMIYMPVVTGTRMWGNDWVFVDEAQDTNPARRALARKMLRSGGRAVFVGDRHQAIYGFTGADADAIDQIIRDFSCTRLPLTVTYRCPKEVVKAAQTMVSHIEAHESAPDGSVTRIQQPDLIKQDLTADDAILCRKTAPLVEAAYSFIRNGIACHVEGKDIGVGLLKLANKWSVRNLDDLRDRLEAYRDREVEKLMSKGRETQAEALTDRVETLFVLMDGCQDVDCLRQKIATMFMDSENEAKPTLTLSTVHKAKGREWDRVFVLGGNVWMPSPFARQEWQMEQESNLIYVAYTRAKDQLVMVDVVQ